MLVARPGLEVKNVPELIALAKKSKLSYSSWGNGSLEHVSGETFKSAAKIDLLNVPYSYYVNNAVLLEPVGSMGIVGDFVSAGIRYAFASS